MTSVFKISFLKKIYLTRVRRRKVTITMSFNTQLKMNNKVPKLVRHIALNILKENEPRLISRVMARAVLRYIKKEGLVRHVILTVHRDCSVEMIRHRMQLQKPIRK